MSSNVPQLSEVPSGPSFQFRTSLVSEKGLYFSKVDIE